MALDDWTVLDTFGDRISAMALMGLLESERMRCRFVSNEPVPGLGTQFAVLVPTKQLTRAQSIREQATVTEQELTELAISTRPREPDSI